MNPTTPPPPAPIPRRIDLSSRLLDRDNRVLATGGLRLDDDDLCHFSPDLHETLNSGADAPSSIEIDGFGSHSIRDWRCRGQQVAPFACQAEFRLVE